MLVLRLLAFHAFALALALALVVAPARAEAACGPAGEGSGPRAVAHATLCLLNAQRAAHGLAPLRADGRLKRAAGRHSRAMVRSGFFEHTVPGGPTVFERVRRAGYPRGRRWAVAENLAYGGGASGAPAAIVRLWMGSPGHRANILDARFTEIGIGIVRGTPPGEAGLTYTTDFGRV